MINILDTRSKIIIFIIKRFIFIPILGGIFCIICFLFKKWDFLILIPLVILIEICYHMFDSFLCIINRINNTSIEKAIMIYGRLLVIQIGIILIYMIILFFSPYLALKWMWFVPVFLIFCILIAIYTIILWYYIRKEIRVLWLIYLINFILLPLSLYVSMAISISIAYVIAMGTRW